MKFENQFLILFFVYIFSISCSFAAENKAMSYMPKNKSEVTKESRYKGYYTGNDGKRYQFISCGYNGSTLKMLFANKIYELFGFSVSSQYLIPSNEIAPYQKSGLTSIISEYDSNLKQLSDCSNTEIVAMRKELAKLHLVLSLVDNSMEFTEEDFGVFTLDQKIRITNPTRAFAGMGECEYHINYSSNAKEFEELINPLENWFAAKIFQDAFHNYTLKHPQELIDWLDSCWDEDQIDALFKQIGLQVEMIFQNEMLLRNLKLRFQDIKKRLEAIKSADYKLYTREEILRLIEENIIEKPQNKYTAKNIHYEFVDTTPIVEEQAFICSDGSRVWLELTNFEFLVNSEESNKLVKMFIGDISSSKESVQVVEKQSIEIFDPESMFVFQDAVVRYWNNLPQDHTEDTVMMLAKTIQTGYAALNYHFGFSESLEPKYLDMNLASSCYFADLYKSLYRKFASDAGFSDLVDLYKSIHQKFASDARTIHRFVTAEEIERHKTKDLIAYYPNPIYLDDLTRYIRPQGMEYQKYIEKTVDNLRMAVSFNCDKRHISKDYDSNYDLCDVYTQILERLYPEVTYQNATLKYTVSDLKRLSIYTFRGDSHNIDEVYDSNGFWATSYCLNDKGSLSYKERKEQMLAEDLCWKLEGDADDGSIRPGHKVYVSTSRMLDVTSTYGKNLYVTFADGGLSLPVDLNGKKLHDVAPWTLWEIAVPGAIEWKNIAGARNRRELSGEKQDKHRKKHLVGPVFLKSYLVEHEHENFWQILQIMGGKKQCLTPKIGLKIMKDCVQFLEAPKKTDVDIDKLTRKIMLHFFTTPDLSKQENQDFIDFITKKRVFSKKDIYQLCNDILSNAAGLLPYFYRRL